MQKKMRLPLIILCILGLLVAAGCAWIFLIARSPAMCLSRGNTAMNGKQYARAIRYYELALENGADDADAEKNLAEAYRAEGNYTKAEYTLVRAIGKHSDRTELYVALSRTYVEQGKFLDAAQLIDRAANDAVRAELEAMRPDAPHLTPEGGFFSDFLEVSAYCAAGHLYLSDDGDYPSSLKQTYEKPYLLPRGETTLCAIVADDRGLVSPLVKNTYTVSGVVEEVTVEDVALDALLRGALGKGLEDTLMSSDLWTVETLEVSSNIKDLSRLSYCVGLKKLTVDGSVSSSLSFLTNMPELEELTLSGRTVSAEDLQNISLVKSLKKLNLAKCALKNIDVLANLTELEELNLSDNIVENLDALASMTHLQVLNLHNNPVTTLSAIRGCTELREVDVSACDLTNLNALADRTNLEKLNASANTISTTEALKGCTGLKVLNLSENKLTKFAELSALTALEDVNLSYNELTELPKLDLNTSMLRNIDLTKNKITGVEFLRDLIYLNYVNADDNKIKDLSPLAGCYNLVSVSVWDNPIDGSTVKSLTDHSILVHYKPQ